MKKVKVSDEVYMEHALKLAKKAYKEKEVPVGCIIVLDGKIIGKGYNKKEKKNMSTKHAEIIAIENASRKIKDWRLDNCTLYVTLEPCVMCSGAIKEARIKKIYFGAYDKKNGYSLYIKNFFRKEEIRGGFLEDESKKLLKEFFVELRRGAGVDERDGLENR